ncbi:MAG: lipopolysaccharide assembly protein LapA domain-containing protein [Acidimicrobiia bacterium]|nr:lipopolysaccharide assembly protein LapA domain-containing protein [Acidimicrobiia bacterium]
MTDSPDIPEDDIPEDDIPEDDIVEAEVVADRDVEVTPAVVETDPVTVPRTDPAAAYKGAGFRWSFVFGILLSVLVIILVFQNFGTVLFKFLTWQIEAPLAVVILGSIVVAVIIDELVGFVWRARRRRLLRAKAELKELKRQAAPESTSRFRRNK